MGKENWNGEGETKSSLRHLNRRSTQEKKARGAEGEKRIFNVYAALHGPQDQLALRTGESSRTPGRLQSRREETSGAGIGAENDRN